MAHQDPNHNHQYASASTSLGGLASSEALSSTKRSQEHGQNFQAPGQPYDPYLPPGQSHSPLRPPSQPDFHQSFQPPSQVELRAGFYDDLQPPQQPFRDDDSEVTPIGTPQMKEQTLADGSAYPPQSKYSSIAARSMPSDRAPPKGKRNRILLWLILFVIALAAIVVGLVYAFVIKPKQKHKSDSTNTGTDAEVDDGAKNDPVPTPSQTPVGNVALIGRNGDTVTMENGETFVYKNDFGGYFMDASKTDNPFQDGAQAQFDTPPLNVSWDYGKHIIRGVNLGGWLVLEPFITPAFYQKYQNYPGFESSEWMLSEAMAADTASGGIGQIEKHYKEFITEQDFADIVAAGMNWIRLPIPYWCIEVWDGEPFLPKVSWTYVLKAFEWARKYGLRINLDLHTIPGSQNGWNHSGRYGQKNWMEGPMGYANAQRSLDYMRIIVQFISQPQYKNVVPMFGIINEPRVAFAALEQFYLEAYTMIRSITGIGAGNGPIISIHDRFDTSHWAGFLTGADRVALDCHNYFAFADDTNKPVIDGFVTRPCLEWGRLMNETRRSFGVTTGGEWSLGYNDCGLFLVNGVQDLHSTLNCESFWNQWEDYPQSTKDQLHNFALASMEGMRDFFFWTWKILPAQSGRVEAPLWSYKLGLDNGWMPKDPSKAIGHCAAAGVDISPADAFDGNYAPSATGGPRAPKTLAAEATATIGSWPPTRLEGEGGAAYTVLAAYTPTGPIPTLPGPTVTPPATATINGWQYPKDTAGVELPIADCQYPDAWTHTGPIPTACGAA